MSEHKDQIRVIDQVVLQKVAEGIDTTHKISEATTFKTHRVRYSLKKLDSLNYLNVEKRDGMEEDVIDGQRRIFQAPLRGELTDSGEEYLKQNKEDLDQYHDLSREELVTKVQELESQVEELQQSFEVFRKQVQREL